MSGAQVGYNWQVGAWLLGFETDFQLATVDGKTRFDRAIFDLGPSAFHTDVATNLKYFGTARLRAGYLITPAVLAYATGGLAYGRVESSLAFPAVSGAPNTFFDSETHWHTGWTVGGGLEAKVSDRGTLKVEYLYADLGTERPTFFIANDFYNWNQRIDLHVVRLGFNVLLLPVTR
jgi:outer membrane immunogenic protein